MVAWRVCRGVRYKSVRTNCFAQKFVVYRCFFSACSKRFRRRVSLEKNISVPVVSRYFHVSVEMTFVCSVSGSYFVLIFC